MSMMPVHKVHRLPLASPVRLGGGRLFAGIVTLLLFLLLREWLQPLKELSDITEIYIITPLYVAIGCFLFLDWIRVSLMWGLVIKIAVILIVVGWLFNNQAFPDLNGWIAYFHLCDVDAASIYTGNFTNFSPQNRTVLFLVGWGLLATAIHSIMIYKRQGFWFVGATLLYLVLIQLWTGLDTSTGLIRTVGIGFFLVCCLNLPPIHDRHISFDSALRWTVKWSFFTLTILCLSWAAGYYGAKSISTSNQSLQWPRLAQWIDSIPGRFGEGIQDDTKKLTNNAPNRYGGVLSAAKTGYSMDDSVLGGPLQQDETVAFVAKTEQPTYWRGESKDFYDGKGWTQRSLPTVMENAAESKGIVPRKGRRTITQEVLWREGGFNSQLFAGGHLIKVDALITKQGKLISPQLLERNVDTDKYTLELPLDLLSYYKIQVEVPVKDDTLLLNKEADVGISYPNQIKAQYLQLPKQLPGRIGDLAKHTISGISRPYAQAQAIEHFLRANYTYTLNDAKVSNPHRDFVDQFLFEQKKGYCDYFSTAMVVMLRSIGIPARWVKGYAPGEVQTNFDDNQLLQANDKNHPMYTVTVRNRDAHSWVEAYFPGEGWMSFDPTPAFAGSINEDGGQQSQEVLAKQSITDQKAANIGIPFLNSFLQSANQNMKLLKRKLSDLAPSLLFGLEQSFHWARIIIGLAVVALGLFIAVALWGRRKQISLWLLLHGFHQRAPGSVMVLKIMDKLWMIIFHKLGPKKPQQTLREYVAALRLQPELHDELIALAQLYEASIYYSIQASTVSRKRLLMVWIKLRRS